MTLEIRKLDASNANALFKLLENQNSKYKKYFIPFQEDPNVILDLLTKVEKDLWYGFFNNHELIGFHMLRGFDDNYEIPSFGVLIHEDYSNSGLGKLALDHSESILKIMGLPKMMLKVHPENAIAKKMYERSGFEFSHPDPKNGHLIYYKKIGF